MTDDKLIISRPEAEDFAEVDQGIATAVANADDLYLATNAKHDPPKTYLVAHDGGAWACSCPHFQYRVEEGGACKHIRRTRREFDDEYVDDGQETLVSDGGETLDEYDDSGDGGDADDDYPDEIYDVIEESDADAGEIKESYDNLMEYRTPVDEAIRTVASRFGAKSTEAQTARDQSVGEGEATPLSDIDDAGEWHDVEARVYGRWSHGHDSITEKGVLVDDTGAIPYLIWDGADVDALDVDDEVRLDNAVTDEFDDSVELHINSATVASETDADISLPEGVNE